MWIVNCGPQHYGVAGEWVRGETRAKLDEVYQTFCGAYGPSYIQLVSLVIWCSLTGIFRGWRDGTDTKVSISSLPINWKKPTNLDLWFCALHLTTNVCPATRVCHRLKGEKAREDQAGDRRWSLLLTLMKTFVNNKFVQHDSELSATCAHVYDVILLYWDPCLITLVS